LSKAERLEILRRNVTSKDNDLKRYEEEMAFFIFYIEKEFNVGLITDDFPMLKVWNLIDEVNIDKYNNAINKGTSGGTNKTFR